ncbi:MAG: hypothetical protein HC836_44170, partial [Richelia sp. RM2_1_2]|nr:hypothetical protein [Richelia sp. RM2_1_2]
KIQQIKDTDGAELIYSDPSKKIIVASVSNYRASQKLGSPNWCISYSNSHWDSYTENNAQYFIWDYNYPNTDKHNIIGATMKPNGSFLEMQNALNEPVKREYGSPENYLDKVGVPIQVLKEPLEKLEQEKEKRKFEEIKSKSAEQVTQNDIQFLQKRFTTAEQMIEFIGQTYGKMPRFALSYILEMPAVDRKKIIPEILKTMKGKFVDEDDFYYMINTDNIARIYPEIDADKFRDTVIAYIKKARRPDEYDNALIYSYIIHNLNNFNEVMADIGEEGLRKLTESEIQYIINLAITKDNKEVIRKLEKIGRLPNFKPDEYIDIIEALEQKNIPQPVQKVTNIFGKDFLYDISSRKIVEMIMHLSDDLFNDIFTIAGDDLVAKLSPQVIDMIKRTPKYSRIENLIKAPLFPDEPKVEKPREVVPITNIGSDNAIYAELLKAKGKRDLDIVINKYGKAALRTVSPSNVAKILKNTSHPNKLVDVFGRELVQKAMDDPAGGSTLKMKLNQSAIKPDEIAEQENGFDFLGIHAKKTYNEIVNSKEFQIQFVHDLANGLKNTTDWHAVKEEGKVKDKHAGYSWNSIMEEYEFTYDFNGKLIPIKIWVDNKNPLFMTGQGTRFRIDWLNSEKGKQYKEIILKNLDKQQ